MLMCNIARLNTVMHVCLYCHQLIVNHSLSFRLHLITKTVRFRNIV
jgi:hypothetical protein